MKCQDVKIGMEVVMTKRYSTDILKGEKYKILRPQSEDGQNSCFIVDHAGEDSFLAPYCEYFEPTDPDFVASSSGYATAEEYLKERGINPKEPIFWYSGNEYITMEQAMTDYAKLYACEKVKETLKLAAERAKATHRFVGPKGSAKKMEIYVEKQSILSLETEILTKINKEV